MFAGYLFLRFKDGHEICQINPSQTLINLQYSFNGNCMQHYFVEMYVWLHVLNTFTRGGGTAVIYGAKNSLLTRWQQMIHVFVEHALSHFRVIILLLNKC